LRENGRVNGSSPGRARVTDDRPPPAPVIDRIGRPRSLAVIAADQIRELIVTDRLRLGQQLSEAGLAEQLGISRTPVRDALLRLQAERLVEIQPQHGSFVFRYDAGQLRSILGLREILEVGALRVALKGNRPHTLDALAAAVAAAEPIVALGPEAFQLPDTAFHGAILQASQNPELIDAYGRIIGRVRAIRFRVTRTMAQIRKSQADHCAVVAAIRAGDDAVAEEVLARHVYNSYFVFTERADADIGSDAGPGNRA
jgi:DNA-binding GntR family transcriptional regulator